MFHRLITQFQKNPDITNALRNGIRDTFCVQLKLPVNAAMTKTIMQRGKVDSAVGAQLELKNPKEKGYITMHMSEELFLDIYYRMTGEKHLEIKEEMNDALAELLNIAHVKARALWGDSEEMDFERGIPQVMEWAKLEAYLMKAHQGLVMPFVTEKGTLYLEISV